MSELLNIQGLKVLFVTARGLLKAVEGVDIVINEGECTAIVGESGCGKTVTSHAIMKLLSTPPAVVTAKSMLFTRKHGGETVTTDLIKADENEMLKIRGNEISMIFQDPSSALNPVLTIGSQIDEAFIRHRNMKKKEAKQASIELLRAVGVPAPEYRYSQFPHELSGGMKQRVLIAIATACNPKLMIADEPTTALDVTIQAQILDLLRNLQQKNNMALLLITHDIGVVANFAQKVYVMYCGKIVESGDVSEVIANPLHPYTRGLLNAVPSLDKETKRLEQIPYSVPHPLNKPTGCYFHPRCSSCRQVCRKFMPPLTALDGGRQVRCWMYGDNN